MKQERVIDRLLAFAEFCKKGKMCKTRNDFERICGLTHNYLYNTKVNAKTSVGSDAIAKIHDKFPMLNLTWVITGKGSMITHEPDEGYREAYGILQKKIEEMRKIMDGITFY